MLTNNYLLVIVILSHPCILVSRFLVLIPGSQAINSVSAQSLICTHHSLSLVGVHRLDTAVWLLHRAGISHHHFLRKHFTICPVVVPLAEGVEIRVAELFEEEEVAALEMVDEEERGVVVAEMVDAEEREVVVAEMADEEAVEEEVVAEEVPLVFL